MEYAPGTSNRDGTPRWACAPTKPARTAKSAEKPAIIGTPKARSNIRSNDVSTIPLPPAAVLDTNVALDGLLFGEPSFAPLQRALDSGALHWLACRRMHDELAHVLEHRLAARRCVPTAELLARWRAGVQWCADPAPASLQLPRCRDADDQVFIELAVERRARWLITRDRALLALARRLRPWSVAVVTPQRWAADHSPPQAAAADSLA